MPPKIRDLLSDLERVGFVNRSGRANHRNFVHPNVARPITISGNPGNDAKRYQVRAVRAAIEESRMNASARYVKIVEWSGQDRCYVGSAPSLFYGGCHGDNERQVFDELCQAVDEAIALYRADRKPLPPPTSGRDLANLLLSAV